MVNNKRIILFFLLVSLASMVVAQQNDSLWRVKSKAKTTKERFSVRLALSEAYWYLDLDSSLFYANELLSIAKKEDDKSFLGDAQNAIGNAYATNGDYINSIDFYQEAYKIRLSLGLKAKAAASLYNIATTYSDKRDFLNAIDYYKKAALLHGEAGNHLLEAGTIHDIAAVYVKLNAPSKALEYYITALNILYANGLNSKAGNIHNSIGNLHKTMLNFDLALEHYQRALDIYTANGTKFDIAMALNNIGVVYDEKGDFPTALQYYTRSLELGREMKDKTSQAVALNNLGYLYVKTMQYDKATSYYFESLRLSEEVKDAYSVSNTKNNIANVFLKKEQYELCFKYTKEALKGALEIQAVEVEQESYEILGNLNAKRGNFKEAFLFKEKAMKLKDSLYNKESNQKLLEIQATFDMESKESEINGLKKDNQISKLQLEAQKTTQHALIIGIILLVALGSTLFYNIRMKKRNNQLLTTSNVEMEKANQKLVESEANLRQLNATKDKFFSIIAHDLKNPFNALLGFSEILATSAEEESLADVKTYSKAVKDSAEKLYRLIDNLLEWSRAQTGKVPFTPNYFSVDTLINEEIGIQNQTLKTKNITAHMLTKDPITAYGDKTLIGTVLRNIISNAIKFSLPGGNIWVATRVFNDYVEIAITDSGIGIEQNRISTIFNLESSESTQGTWDEKGTGLGLLICHEFVVKNNGEIWVESMPGKGTTFFFTLPTKQGDLETS